MKENLCKLSAEFCEKNKIAVLKESDTQINIGYVEKPVEELLQRLERYYQSKKSLCYEKISEEEFEVLIERLYSGEDDEEKFSMREEKETAATAAKSPPAVNLLNSIISEGIMKGASDIHIAVSDGKTTVRYRKDGRLKFMFETDEEKGKALTARIKLLSDLNIMEHRRCLDGRFEYSRAAYIYDIRVSIIPGTDGESSVLRILGGDIKVPPLESLGFTKKQLEMLEEMLKKESGLILVTGPTGSGKTTTLASIISRLNKEDLQIITVEDPVEYRIKNVLQVSTEEESGRSFSEVLRRLLRHDPDILMVGEIRDEETAAITCRLALTGHLVFASLHTASCEESPLRLTDMGVPPYVVAAVLKGVISQRLIEKKEGGRKLKAEILLFKNQSEVRSLCGQTL